MVSSSNSCLSSWNRAFPHCGLLLVMILSEPQEVGQGPVFVCCFSNMGWHFYFFKKSLEVASHLKLLFKRSLNSHSKHVCLLSWMIMWASTTHRSHPAEHSAWYRTSVCCSGDYGSLCVYKNEVLASDKPPSSTCTGRKRNNLQSKVIICLVIYFLLAGLWLNIVALITWHLYSELGNLWIFEQSLMEMPFLRTLDDDVDTAMGGFLWAVM